MNTMTTVVIFCTFQYDKITSYRLKVIFEHSRESHRFFYLFSEIT